MLRILLEILADRLNLCPVQKLRLFCSSSSKEEEEWTFVKHLPFGSKRCSLLSYGSAFVSTRTCNWTVVWEWGLGESARAWLLNCGSISKWVRDSRINRSISIFIATCYIKMYIHMEWGIVLRAFTEIIVLGTEFARVWMVSCISTQRRTCTLLSQSYQSGEQGEYARVWVLSCGFTQTTVCTCL